MYKIDVNLLIEPVQLNHNEVISFDNNWNFKIDKYEFKIVNTNHVEVCFSFEASLGKTKNGLFVEETPSVFTREYQQHESNLELMLDLLSLDLGFGLKIKENSQTFNSQPLSGSRMSTGTKYPINKIQIKIKDIVGIEKRFQNIIQNNQLSNNVANGLRLYRYSLFSDLPDERVQKLWTVIEKMYGTQKGKLLNEDELKVINNFFDSWVDLESKKKEVLSNRIVSTYSKSLIEVLSEKIILMNNRGDISADETKRMLKTWHSKRSIPAHGSVLSKRDSEIDIMLWEMKATVESLLYGEVYPKMIQYIVFKKSSLNKAFITRQGKLVSQLNNEYFALPIRHDETNIYTENLPIELVKNHSYVFLVSHNKVVKITKYGTKKIELKSLEIKLQDIINKIVEKLNGK